MRHDPALHAAAEARDHHELGVNADNFARMNRRSWCTWRLAVGAALGAAFPLIAWAAAAIIQTIGGLP